MLSIPGAETNDVVHVGHRDPPYSAEGVFYALSATNLQYFSAYALVYDSVSHTGIVGRDAYMLSQVTATVCALQGAHFHAGCLPRTTLAG